MTQTVDSHRKRVCFVGMLGAQGSYDASVYEHYADTDDEGAWFMTRFGGIDGFAFETCNISHGDALPDLAGLDGIILGGSHNSVHDDTEWQQRLREWLPRLRAENIPVLAICGSHQLLSQAKGASVERLADGPYAGTLPVRMTPEGRASALLQSIPDDACFQFGNSQHVVDVPQGAVLLASSGRNPVAVLDFGNHCYATQFHPECTHDRISTIWRCETPSMMDRYFAEDNGYKLVTNFLAIVAGQSAK